MAVPVLDNKTARRLFLDRHMLLRRTSGPAKGQDLEHVLGQLGFVQVDSVNTMARAHDHILWARRGQYRPAALEAAVARRRTAFEHWTHDASAIPMAFYSMWRLKFERDAEHMQTRWKEWRRAGWTDELDSVLRHIDANGPTCSRDIGPDSGKGTGGWWDWHPSKTALEYLWRSGHLAICHRKGFQKFYDMRERVIPAECRKIHREDDEIIDWALTAALDRLGFATSGELSAFFDIVTKGEAKTCCANALAAGKIVEVDVAMADGRLRRSFSTEAILDSASALSDPISRVRVLSPFDPALRDRARAERLFGFHYRIEIFVPEHKRQYGYYVFPVFQGDRAIGRLDAKREGDSLHIRAFWPEAGVRMGKGRQAALIAELERLLHLAQTRDIRFVSDWLRPAPT